MLNGTIFRLRSGCQWNRLPLYAGRRRNTLPRNTPHDNAPSATATRAAPARSSGPALLRAVTLMARSSPGSFELVEV